jgi:hypothetical protein
MLDKFNNIWVFIICFILVIFIIKKIYNLNKPFDENRFIEQHFNKQHIGQQIQDNFSLGTLSKSLSKMTSYYVGLN